jgi:hypothetical protein
LGGRGLAADAIDGPSVRAFVIAAMRLAGVAVDEDTLARVLPIAEATLADGPRLSHAAGSGLEPLAHPGGPVARR